MKRILKGLAVSLLSIMFIWSVSTVYARNVLPNNPIIPNTPNPINQQGDSTMVAPINNTAVPMAPIIKTGQPASITGGNYSSVKSCPGDPSANSTDQPYSKPNCPDINGKYTDSVPADPAKSCPDVCKVTNYVAPNYTSAKEGVCPVGYAQIGAFNMQEEVSSNTGMTHVATSLADLNSYTSKGWTCPASRFSNGTWCVACNSTGGDTVPGGADGGWVSSVPSDSQRRPGRVFSTSTKLTINGQKNFNKGTNCGKGTPMCRCGDPGSCIAGGGSNSVFAYYYDIYTCTPIPGSVHATGQYIPATKICARIKPSWN